MRFLEESKKRHRCHLILAALLAGFVILAPFVYAIQLRRLAQEQDVQLKTQSDLLKANEQLREIGDLTQRQSQALSEKAEETLMSAARTMKLSARGYHRTIKLARTIADLADSETIEPSHMLEALQYRARDL